MKNKTALFIVLISVSLLLLLSFITFLFFPYIKAEYYTATYGDDFEALYEQIGWIEDIEYFKVIGYSDDKATVIYVEKNHNTCFKVEFVLENGGWEADGFDCVWSKSGSADSFMWPYYR